jgi:hypothetical protein
MATKTQRTQNATAVAPKTVKKVRRTTTVAAKASVTPVTVAKKPVRKTRTAPKRSAKTVAKVAAVKPVVRTTKPTAHAAKPANIFPAPNYTRWTLVTIGEYYLVGILLCLVVLGIMYWLTAMTSLWSYAHVA